MLILQLQEKGNHLTFADGFRLQFSQLVHFCSIASAIRSKKKITHTFFESYMYKYVFFSKWFHINNAKNGIKDKLQLLKMTSFVICHFLLLGFCRYPMYYYFFNNLVLFRVSKVTLRRVKNTFFYKNNSRRWMIKE